MGKHIAGSYSKGREGEMEGVTARVVPSVAAVVVVAKVSNWWLILQGQVWFW